MSLTRELATEIRQLRMLWRKSDDQYRTKPTAMCTAWRRDDKGVQTPCPGIAHPDYDICDGCRKKHRRKKDRP